MKKLIAIYLDRSPASPEMLRWGNRSMRKLAKTPYYALHRIRSSSGAIGFAPCERRTAFPASTRRFPAEFFASAGFAPIFACRTFWTVPASSARRRTGDNFVGVRHKTSARRSESREGSSRRKYGRRETAGICAIRSERPFACLRRIRPPSGSSRPSFQAASQRGPQLIHLFLQPIIAWRAISGAAPRAQSGPAARIPTWPPRRKRKGDPGQRPRHACKSS